MLQRLLWTVGLVFVYVLGRRISLGIVPLASDLGQEYDLARSLDTLAMVSGGHFSKHNLFSLGLGPWMTSMMLWRFLTLFKFAKSMTNRNIHRLQMGMLLVVALIQAYGYTSVGDYSRLAVAAVTSEWAVRLVTMVVMVAGTYVLMWLANLNTQRGLGGPSVIVIANMTLVLLVNSFQLVKVSRFSPQEWLLLGLFLLLLTSLLIGLTIIVYRAEFRIPIRRIMIVSSLAGETYIPIKITPAGGLPFMYAMTLMVLPTIALSILLLLFPDQGWLQYLSQHFGLSDLPGLIFYLFLLFILAIGFAYFNLDPNEIAEEMQKNGDFIEGIRPGRATEKYINHYLWRLSIVGAVYTSLMGGLPMFLVWHQSGQMSLALLVNNIYILTTLMLGIVEQVSVMQTWKEYGDLI